MHRGADDGVDNVGDRRPAREVVDRFGEALRAEEEEEEEEEEGESEGVGWMRE